MSLANKVLHSYPVQKFLYKQGYLKQDEVIKNAITDPLLTGDKDKILSSIKKLQDPIFWNDVVAVSKEINYLNQTYKQAVARVPEDKMEKALYFLNTINVIGYEPAGSVLKKLYPRPFAPYAFLADNYWASDKARKEFRIDVERDGWVLTAPDRTAKARIKAVYNLLMELGIDFYWVDWCDNLNTFGNFWNLWDANMLGGVKGSPIMLLPEKLTPIYEPFQDEIIAWEYVWKQHRFVFPIDYRDLDHVMTYSMRSRQIGSPALSSMIVEVEADMHATIYNNTVMQKGGLLKGIIALEKPDDSTTINYENQLDYSDRVQQMINRKLAGIRGGGQLVAMSGVANYHDLNKLGEIDGIYQKSSDRTAARTAMLHGITPSRIGITSFSQYKNKMEVADSMALSMDNNQYYYTAKVAKYINEEILQKRFKIYDVQIRASGEFGSISTAAADFGVKIAQMGARILTVDEFRTKVLHWEPYGGELGSAFIGDLLNQDQQTIEKAVGPIYVPWITDGKNKIQKHKPEFIKYY